MMALRLCKRALATARFHPACAGVSCVAPFSARSPQEVRCPAIALRGKKFGTLTALVPRCLVVRRLTTRRWIEGETEEGSDRGQCLRHISRGTHLRSEESLEAGRRNAQAAHETATVFRPQRRGGNYLPYREAPGWGEKPLDSETGLMPC